MRDLDPFISSHACTLKANICLYIQSMSGYNEVPVVVP